MKGELFKDIPREKIHWYPTIDYEKCENCGTCVDYCKLGAYSFEEKEGKMKVFVTNPYNCVVLCTGCQPQCPVGAISHPSKEVTRKIIKKLKNDYPTKPL